MLEFFLQPFIVITEAEECLNCSQTIGSLTIKLIFAEQPFHKYFLRIVCGKLIKTVQEYIKQLQRLFKKRIKKNSNA